MSLLRQIERHLQRTGTSATRFGRIVARDPRLVLDMRRGREVGGRLATRIVNHLASGS